MMKMQRLPFLTIATFLFGLVAPAMAATPPSPAPAPKGQVAGSITALLPVARITRGAGKNLSVTDAKKGDEVVWNDKVKTERGGRARITLADQSILSLGSQAELTIVKHDARNQQTALQLGYGRVRAEVSKITRQGGGFELRTPTAVAGVIGTDFGTEADTVGTTTFVCISGLVAVSNSDPNIAGSVQCAPGLTTTVTAGKAPTPPTNASPQQIQQLIQDTEPAIISAMAPMSALPGATIDATLNGTKMSSVNKVTVSPDNSGVTVSMSGTPTDNAVTVHIVIANNAAPGPRTIHLGKTSGADSAAVFTILAPPTAATGDLKKPYLDLLGQIGTTSAGGLSAYLAQLQQEASQAIQDLQQKNANASSVNDATNAFNGQVSVVQNAINNAVTQINTAVTQASTSFQTQYDAAYKSLLDRHPDGTADDQFNNTVKTSYDSIASSLGNTIKAITGNLTSVVSSATTNIAQTQQTFLQQITAANNPPVPAMNYTERNIDLGAALGQGGIPALDASNSKGVNGASIISYKWVLCDPSYKPAQVGVPLAATATGCNAVQGYQSSSSDFQFQTCSLPANDYVARVTVTDSNGQSAAMDAKLHVLAPVYDDPTTLVRSLAQAYTTLQPNTFLAFFDQTGFAGFTALSENVRNTFPTLASMQINPRISQSAITCNDATVRADWVQNYTYKTNANIAFSQTEQLSMRMTRTPGKGWFITDFQGDNGTVQGQLPGPVVTDSPQPDLVALGVYPTYVGQTSTNPPVPPGTQSFTAVIQNVGGADFTANTVVRFQLLDASSTPLGVSVDVPLPTPVAAGQTVNVQGSMTVPNTIAVGTQFHVLANVNPTCLPEAHCDASNQADEVLLLGTPIKLGQLTTPALQVGGPSAPLTISVSGAAPVTITLPTGITTADPLTQTTTAAGNVTWNLVAGFTAVSGANQTITISANAGIPVTLAAAYSVTAPAFNQAATSVPTLTAGNAAQPLSISVNVPGTYTLVLPSGITTTSANPQTITAAGSLTWNIASNFTAATGTGLTANVTAGIYSFAAKYNNNGQANYVITSVTFANHTAPFTGVNALQKGENTSVVAVIQNVGNASPTGTITVNASCKPVNPADTTSCKGSNNPTGTVSAPAAGQSVTVNMPLNNGGGGGGGGGDLPGSFIGTVVLTTTIPQSSTADDTTTIGFDQSDFVVTVSNPLTPQNIIPGSTQTVGVNVQVVGTTPFAIPVSITTTPAYSGITFTPSTSNVTGSQAFTVNAGSTTPTGGFGAVITGINRGVTRVATQGFSVMNPQIVMTNLFLNDANNPLEVQVNNTTAQTVGLQLSGASFSGLATITVPTVTGFSISTDATAGVSANGTFNVSFLATAPTTAVVPITVTAQLPNTSPVLSISKTIYVKSVGLPDLQIVSATPSVTFSSGSPWLDGQGVDYTVVVKNAGTATTAGGEMVHMDVNGVPLGSTTLTSALAPGATQQVTIHAVAPDIHGNGAFSGTGTVRVKVDPDQVGDINYTNNSVTSTVAMANWHFGVSGAGTQASPLALNVANGFVSSTASFSGLVDGAPSYAYSPTMFNAVSGQASTGISIGSFSLSTPGAFTASVSASGSTLQSGAYFAQVLVQMLDNGNVTAQRQATVWINLSNAASSTTVAATLTSSANNCTGSGCSSSTGTPLQINGGLAEQFSVTLNLTCTTVGTTIVTAPCPGTADLAIQDASNTDTTPLGSAKGVPTGSPLVLRVGAAYDPNGNIQTGAASNYLIGINGVQHSAVRQGQASTSPDPVGTQVQFLINVGDLGISANTGANSCTGVVASGQPVSLNVSWQPSGGFNSPTLSWQWEDGNHSPVGGSPLSFSAASGTSTYSGGSYTGLPTFTLTNAHPQDGLAQYFLAVTISNGTATATKYFPFYFDLSLGQNFCGAASSARGYNRIQGSWSRSAAGLGGPMASQMRALLPAGTPDIHISASDVSFTPSIPKVGEAVQVRFRATNTGDADAAGMPIALQVNGVTVASDTFDVAKGRSVLGGLTWTATADVLRAASKSGSTVRTRVKGKLVDPDSNPQQDDAALSGGPVQLQAAVVVDPLHTKQQKSAVDKTAALAHFSLRGDGPVSAGGSTLASSQRMLVELEDGACLGLRLSTGGILPCGSADLEVTIGDLSKSLLSLDAMSGVGDVGSSFQASVRTDTSSVRFTGQAAGMAGHTYAVQLPNGRTAVVNVESVRNPAELDAKARALFRSSAARVLRSMGDSNGAQDTGDLTGGGSHPTVFIVLNVQGM